ncbi:DegT/DnrJ/EryC1/StrS family aminotransferase [Allorhodopirellula solitaria]|uniref:L-glutamine:2-deoxy-scyllo-inosose aminotransferase n=1 Tax=Allorhodopirellula solitaria TaxID=2527987 RepID=A0A5C5Y027_9BACT|nr:DegT/DnrJ/EryC1/StrS family aminotransferase [Allorhodopirellula solitaria]TWT67565.1 L-glutamine:2-deoxy-scyllo-inosose aminotransferase [Allorhodopirellula solitaria]
MIPLERDEQGWPVWPPQSPEIWESLQQLWASGQWGKYAAEIHAHCTEAVARAMSISNLPSKLPSPWDRDTSRIHATPLTRLCSSGTAAIELSLRCCGVTEGDQVAVAAYDYPGNFRTIELLGATPVLVDVKAGGSTLDPQSLRQVENARVKAVVVSHLYGELADMPAIREICDQRNWMLIEDACQVPGAGWELEGDTADAFLPVGCLSDCATLSFGGSKLLSAGNGGALLARNPRVAARLPSYLDRPSDTFPLSALQCSVLLPQWETLAEFNRRRSRTVTRLREWDWSQFGLSPLASETLGQRRAYYKFAMQADESQDRPALLRRLRAAGFPIGEGFRSMHRTSDRRSQKPVPLPHASELGKRCVVLDHRALLADDLIERLDRYVANSP